MMVRIVPEFEKIFIDFDAPLPVMTLVVIMASCFLVRYWWLMLLLIIPLFLWLFSASRTVSANTLNLLSLLLGVFTVVEILVGACILFALFRPLIVTIVDLSA
jgi:type IV pilus assembly protein PilC